jgi:hypothetical protein
MEFRLDQVFGVPSEEVTVQLEVDGEHVELEKIYHTFSAESAVRITVFHKSENVGWYQSQFDKLPRQVRVNLVHRSTSPTPYVLISTQAHSPDSESESSPVKQFSLESFENLNPKPPVLVPKLAIPLLQPKTTPRSSKLEKVLQELTKEYNTLQAKYDKTTQLQAAQILDLQHQLRDAMTRNELDTISHEDSIAVILASQKAEIESAEIKLKALNLVIQDQRHLISSRDNEIETHKHTIEVYRDFITKLLELFTSQMSSSKQRETRVLQNMKELDKENLSMNTSIASLSMQKNTIIAHNSALQQEKNIERSYRIAEDIDRELVNFIEALDLSSCIDLEATFSTINSIYKEIYSKCTTSLSDSYKSHIEVLKQSALKNEGRLSIENLTTRLKQDSLQVERVKSDNKDLKDYVSSLVTNLDKEKRKCRALQQQTNILSEDITHYRSLVNQLETSSITLKQEKQELHAQMYDTILKSGNTGPEQIDKLLTEYLAANNHPNPFVKMSDGAYSFGNKKVGVLVRNGSLIVRVGGGYMCIEEFIRMHVYNEINKSQEDSLDKSFHSPSYKNIAVVRRTKKQNEEGDDKIALSPVPCDLTYDASNAMNGLKKKDLNSNLPKPSFTPKKSPAPKLTSAFN